MKKAWRLALPFLLVLVLVGLSACKKEETNADGSITLKVLHNWNGSSGAENMLDNPVAEKILEETGVRVEFEYTTGSETERITQMFATGEEFDMYTGPAWGGESEVLLKAANEGQLWDLTEYIEKYPNLAELVKKENFAESLYDNIISKQKGGQFMLHANYPATDADVTNWLYGLYVNKEIASEVGVDPQTVHSPEELYDFLKKIKDANLEVNGNPIYPLGALGGGWPLDIMSEMFVPVAGSTAWFIDDDGNTRLNFMTEEYENYILYMRKLLSEGLLDPEVYTHTDTIAKEKIAQGRVAALPNQFPGLWTELVKAGLQDKYVPLGPMNDFNGDKYRTEVNVTGNNLIAIPKTASKEKLEAAMKLMNFLASDEGYLLANYGIEGVHYEMKDGKVEAKKEWVDKVQKDPKALTNEGVMFGSLSGLNRQVSLAGGPFGYQYDERYKVQAEFEKIMTPDGIKATTGKDPNVVFNEHPKYEQIKAIFDTMGDVVLQAIHATSEGKAKELINGTRDALEKAGIHEVEDEITKQAKSGTEFMRYRTSN
ncbi:extracellular solute-binding protein [Lederbergia graminis]|uniref:Extracellular solute-binding protein n=1 Tax=Lederbergia graminis TaxID=735518 RepID=A0ABW0LK99_9BACI